MPNPDARPTDALAAPGAALVMTKQIEDLEAEVARLRAALERTLHNFEAVLGRRPVRDATETIAEARAALKGSQR